MAIGWHRYSAGKILSDIDTESYCGGMQSAGPAVCPPCTTYTVFAPRVHRKKYMVRRLIGWLGLPFTELVSPLHD